MTIMPDVGLQEGRNLQNFFALKTMGLSLPIRHLKLDYNEKKLWKRSFPLRKKIAKQGLLKL